MRIDSSNGMNRSLRKGATLFIARQKTEMVYFLVSGYMVLERVNRNNDKRVVFVCGPGMLLNEVVLEEPVTSMNCYALTSARVLCIPIHRFKEMMAQDFAFTMEVVDSMAIKIRRLYRQIENTTKMMRLESQVIARLWKLYKDFGVENDQEPGTYTLPFDVSITFLASMVGSNRESVSRVISQLRKEGILDIQRGKCVFYSLEALTKKM